MYVAMVSSVSGDLSMNLGVHRLDTVQRGRCVHFVREKSERDGWRRTKSIFFFFFLLLRRRCLFLLLASEQREREMGEREKEFEILSHIAAHTHALLAALMPIYSPIDVL